MADEITPLLEFPDWHDNPDGGDPFTQDLGASYDKVGAIKANPMMASEITKHVLT